MPGQTQESRTNSENSEADESNVIKTLIGIKYTVYSSLYGAGFAESPKISYSACHTLKICKSKSLPDGIELHWKVTGLCFFL